MIEEKLSDEKLGAFQKIGGYNSQNFSSNIFISSNNTPTLSFKIFDIVVYGEKEILKIIFNNNLIMRLLKFDENGIASSTFDIVNEETKSIILKTDKHFNGGIGIAENFFDLKIISQWEVPILELICRGFVLGDKSAIKNIIKKYGLKIADQNLYKVKDQLGYPEL